MSAYDGYTNSDGVFIWGSPAVLAEVKRREQVGEAKTAQEQAAAHAYTLDQEAQRAEPSPAKSAARALWENAEPMPEAGPSRERERER